MKTHLTAKKTKYNVSMINKENYGKHLPEKNTTRWVAKRKAQVLDAVRNGILTLDEACSRYSLSVEEFVSWQRSFDQKGVQGLSITKNKR